MPIDKGLELFVGNQPDNLGNDIFAKIHNCLKSTSYEFIGLQKVWQEEVGNKIGWLKGKYRVLNGSIGAAESRFEMEISVENLEELEKSWAKLPEIEAHKKFGKSMEPLIVSGSNHWEIFRVVEL